MLLHPAAPCAFRLDPANLGFTTLQLLLRRRSPAFTVAAIPSIRDEVFDHSGLVNIRLSICCSLADAVRVLARHRMPHTRCREMMPLSIASYCTSALAVFHRCSSPSTAKLGLTAILHVAVGLSTADQPHRAFSRGSIKPEPGPPVICTRPLEAGVRPNSRRWTMIRADNSRMVLNVRRPSMVRLS
jgi:hypothetical protein